MWSRLIGDTNGAVMPIFALALVPMMGLVGAAVDYARASSARTAMQASLDATTLMVAKEASTLPENQTSTRATELFSASFNRDEVQSLQVSATVTNGSSGTTVSSSAEGIIATRFMRLFGHETLPIKVHASVATASDGLGCVLALNPSASGAITAQGTTAVKLNGCSLYDNSASDTALTVGGSATISTDFVGVVGGIGSSSSGITTTNGIRTKIAPVVDPYADVEFPPFSGCDEHNYTAKNAATINPGVFCGGITVNANGVLTMNPGMYYLDGGDFLVNGGASVTGTGVTLVFTSKAGKTWSAARINGNATVNLTPMTWGPTKGIVAFADRRTPAGTEFKFNGGANQYLGGAVYVPTGAISYAGGADTSTSCTQIIGDSVTFVGNSNLAIDCSRYNTRPFSTKVMRIAS